MKIFYWMVVMAIIMYVVFAFGFAETDPFAWKYWGRLLYAGGGVLTYFLLKDDKNNGWL